MKSDLIRQVQGGFHVRIVTAVALLPTLRAVLALAISGALFGSTAIAQGPPGSLTNGLVAYFPLNGNANDASGHGLNGVATNTSPTTDRFGTPSAAMSFQGNNSSYIDLGAPTSLQFRSNFTVTAWIKFSGGMINARIVSYGDDNGYELLTFNSGPDRPLLMDFGLSPYFSDSTLPENQWHFVAMRRSGGTVSMFANGRFVMTNTVNVEPTYAANLSIGRKTTTQDGGWGGALDEIRFYNRALSDTELQALFAPPDSLTNGLVAYYPLDGNANDASGHGLNGVAFNISPTTDRFGTPSAAMSFQGNNQSYIDLGAPASLQFRTNFTVTAWMKFSGGMINARVVSYGDDNGYELLTYNSGPDRPLLMDLGLSAYFSDSTLPENQWHFVAMRRSGGRVSMFANGRIVMTNTVHAEPTYNANLSIGRKTTTQDGGWGGALDEIRFYNRALSDIELQALSSPSCLVVPAFAATNDAAFGANWLNAANYRQQVLYAASDFSPTGALAITELRFRPDYFYGHAFTSAVASIQFNLSTTLKQPDHLSTTFAQNVGSNSTVVFNGSLNLSSQFLGPTNGPKAFDIKVPLTTAFIYDPAAGNLLLEVRNFSGAGNVSPLGGAVGFGDGGSRLGGSLSSATGVADTGADALQICYVPTNVPAVQGPPDNLTNGLVAYYPLNGNANDASGHGLNGVAYNTSPTTNRFGIPSSAMSFQGNNQSFIDLGAPTSLQFRSNFTVTAWIKFSGGMINARVVSYGDDNGYELLTYNSGPDRQLLMDLGLSAYFSDSTLPENQWHFVATRRSGGTVSMFANGRFVMTNTVNVEPTYAANLSIGRKTTTQDGGWGGALDEIRFYNRALSDTELQALFSLPGPLDGLVAYYPLNGNANDASGHGLNGVAYNTSPTTNRFGTPSSAMSFQGNNQSYIDIGAPASLQFRSNFTVTAWIKFSGGMINARVVSYGDDNGYELLTYNSGPDRQLLMDLGLSAYFSDSTLPENQWHFVAMRRSGGTVSMFANGRFVMTNTVNVEPTYAANLSIGRKTTTQDGGWGGALDEIRFYNRALSDTELQDLFSLPETPITVVTSYDVSSGFSPTSNPNGPWSLGSLSNLSGNFSLVTFEKNFLSDNGVPISDWQLSDSQGPTFARNMGTTTAISSGGQFMLPPGMVFFSPPSDGSLQNYGVIRWTAPAGGAGDYRIEAAVRTLFDGTRSQDADFHVTRNGVELFGQFLVPNSSTGYTNTITVAAGDRIDFAVGRGQDGITLDSALKIQATITQLIARPTFDLSLDFSLNSNPNGVWSYGWETNLGGAFTLLTVPVIQPSLNGVTLWSWQFSRYSEPAVFFNPTTMTSMGGQEVDPPGAVWFFPGPDGTPENFGVIRFTVPAGQGGTYQLKTAVQPYLTTGSGDTDFHVLKNGAELFGRFLSGTSGITGYTNQLALNAGDQVEFAIGRGADGHLDASGLKIQAALNLVSVTPPPSCVPAPSGLAAWWRAESNALDLINGNNGSPTGGIGFTSGEVGQTFQFNGTTSYIPVPASPSLDIGTGSGVTIECWIRPNFNGIAMPIVEWDSATTDGLQLWVNDGLQLLAVLRDTASNTHIIQSASGAISTNRFQHVALTYEKSTGIAVLYTDGAVVASQNLGSFTPQTTYPLNIGRRTGQPIGLNDTYSGLLDELSLYNRALSQAEIHSIYIADSAGKCVPAAVAPVITTQPADRMVPIGGTATFTVGANGTPPLSYQWYFNRTTPVAGGTNASLSLSSVQATQVGNYSVVVANVVSSVSSSNAALTIIPLSCLPPPLGLAAWWKAESNAVDIVNGNNGAPTGGIGFAGGEVGQAFLFNGTTSYIPVPASPSLNIGTGSGVTIECWIRPNFNGIAMPIVEWDSATTDGLQLWVESSLQLLAILKDTLGNTHVLESGISAISTNNFQHVALTYDKSTGVGVLYINGASVASQNLGSFTPQTTYPLNIGRRTGQPIGLNDTYSGLLDELSLYNRALSQAEIQAAFNADSFGKCVPAAPVRPTYDVSLDFSVTSNPNGVWSYGWETNLGEAFTLLTVPVVQSAVNGVTLWSWQLTRFSEPAVFFNPTTMTAMGGQEVEPPGTVWFDPGRDGTPQNFGVIRLTIPAGHAGTYSLQTAVQPYYVGAGDTDFHVLKNGTELFGRFLSGTSGITTYTNLLPLNAGDIIDFAIGRGADGHLDASALKIQASLDLVPVPVPRPTYDVSLDFSVSSNPNGVWSYGWETNLGEAFTLLTVPVVQSAVNGVTLWSWQLSRFSEPAVFFNPTTMTAMGGQEVEPPGTVWFDPGRDGTPQNFGVIRLTIPAGHAGTYSLQTAVQPYYVGAGDTDFHVLKNGTELFGRFLSGTSGVTTYTNLLALNAGDVIDFAIGRGADGHLDASVLKIQASLDLVQTNPVPPVTVYDVSQGFSRTLNPFGPWSYGWVETFGGPFTLLSFEKNFSSDNGVPISAWQVSNSDLPVVAQNMGTTTALSRGGAFSVPPGTVYFAPGNDGTPRNFGVVRFTVPAGGDGDYDIQTSVHSLFDGAGSVDSDFHVVKNGQELFGQFLPPNSGTGYTNRIHLAAGDRVDFDAGRGADGLTLDSGLKLQATITLVTNPVVSSHAPIANSQSVSVNENGLALITLGASDPDGDPITFTMTPPAHGALTGTPPNLTYRPATEYFGPDSFTFKVNDGVLDSAIATVNITVVEVNEPPVARATIRPLANLSPKITHPQIISANGSNATVILDGSLSTDEENEPLQFFWSTNGAPFAVGVLTTNVLNLGTYTITLTVSEPGASSSDTLTLDIISTDQATDELQLLIDGSTLSRNAKRPLIASLKTGMASLERGDLQAGVNQLQAFQNKVRAQLGRTDPDLAAALIRAAQVIIDAVGLAQ